MISERQAYISGACALHYVARRDAIARDPFQLPLGKDVYEFTKLEGIPGAVRDAGPDAWGRRVIEYELERSAADLEAIDYLLQGPQTALATGASA